LSNYFKNILNPFNLTEKVDIGINYSNRYKSLLESKYDLIQYDKNDYKNKSYMYHDTEKIYINKINEIINLESIISKDLLSLEEQYKKYKKNIN
jgi:hypothetical protein